MLLLKAFIGAIIVVIIDLLSRSKKFYAISGLIPLFPTFALIAHILVYSKQGAVGVKDTALMGFYSLIPYAFYLIGVYFFVEKLPFYITLLISLVLWFISAFAVIYFFYNR